MKEKRQIRIESPGTTFDTRVLTETGADIPNVRAVSWRADVDDGNVLTQASIEVWLPELDVVAEGTFTFVDRDGNEWVRQDSIEEAS